MSIMVAATVACDVVSAVEISDLVVQYGDVVAVDRLSLTAEAGKVTAVLGPNGAGKTSTIETLEGYRTAASGRARVLGLDPVADHRRLCRHVGVMLQSGGVYPTMGAADVLRLFASYYPNPLDVGALLSRLGLLGVARTPWRRLSGGEQQRLSLALAVVGRPKVAFLDEPTAGVDPAGRRVIRDVVAGLRDAGVAVLLTTHELDEAERVADWVVIVDHGQVVAAGTPAELMTSGGGQDIRFAGPPGIDTGALSTRLGAPVTETTPGDYRVDTPSTPSTVAALTGWLAEANLPLGNLRAGRQTLEDVFLRLTGTNAPEPPRGPTS
jgi:ABC-2 type transport system ATP-binding protein